MFGVMNAGTWRSYVLSNKFRKKNSVWAHSTDRFSVTRMQTSVTIWPFSWSSIDNYNVPKTQCSIIMFPSLTAKWECSRKDRKKNTSEWRCSFHTSFVLWATPPLSPSPHTRLQTVNFITKWMLLIKTISIIEIALVSCYVNAHLIIKCVYGYNGCRMRDKSSKMFMLFVY